MSSIDKTNPLVTQAEATKGELTIKDYGTLTGYSFGAKKPMAGEVVFNTGMVGYPEALSDPSYCGQILILTYPLVGNYGVPDPEAKDEHGLPKFLESEKVQISGLIVSEYSLSYSHWNAKLSLGKWLEKAGVPALYGIDTRKLTKLIRESGSLLGKIEFPTLGKQLPNFVDPNQRNLVAEVSSKEIRVFNKGAKPRILCFDCGIKYNIIRYLIRQGPELTVVPYNYKITEEDMTTNFDGIFISNGPGDPSMAEETISSLKYAMDFPKPLPIFGICLGNQLLALAAGAKTYKMKFGNRGMNQPAIDMRTGRCYITPQNHGFAVDSESLPKDWKTFFLNANDNSNEGIIHTHKPFFSVQFHPEACGGPLDTAFLFEMFLSRVNGEPQAITTLNEKTYRREEPIRKVLLVGSGGLSIGQAGEFDYSGSQAIKALKEEGIKVILINPNIATVQTGSDMADEVYLLPITPEFVLEVIDKEKPDSCLFSMGGQTALNVGVKLFESGELEKRGIRVLGTQIPTIVATEDRELFATKLAEIDEKCARTLPAYTVDEAKEAAKTIGYPVLVRAAFALGGLGSGFAANETELIALASKALSQSSQILIDQDLRGWKEVEYEVVRDNRDNCITVCNMENFDPLGIHTGDSIVVAPSQTLSNEEYFRLRTTALKVVRHLGVVGECNIQYALNPHSEEYCIIEVNARLSRSSALASKATGYPLAYVAAKLSLGMDLVTVRNQVTKSTTACFEPSLDYCVVKLPRFDLKKFSKVSNKMGSSMKSVGEVMAIGRNFEETIQKAIRMLDPSMDGFESLPDEKLDSYRNALAMGATKEELKKIMNVEYRLKVPDHQRIFAVAEAFDQGYTVDQIYDLSKIDRWFLSKLKNINDLKHAMKSGALLDPLAIKNLSLTASSSTGGPIAENSPGVLQRSLLNRTNTAPFGENGNKRVNTRSMSSPTRSGASSSNTADIAPLSPASLRGSNHPFTNHTLTSPSLSPSKTGRVTPPPMQLASIDKETMLLLKKMGFSDRQIAKFLGKGTTEMAVRRVRSQLGVRPAIKQIDTLAAEFPAMTNYLYCTYCGDEDDIESKQQGVIVLGCGPYCIGSSVEFDWCAVSCVRQLRKSGVEAVVINYNPETVSTDYDESDRLYFEELSFERVLDIYEFETSAGVVVSVGGQIPNQLALPLHNAGVHILGTSPMSIDMAEDRHKFSALLDALDIDQPKWTEVTTSSPEKIRDVCENEIGYPVLVRPSYVLSGAAMAVAANYEQLENFLQIALGIHGDNTERSADNPVVISKFILNAKEIEFDGVANEGTIMNYAISEHVENAGVHSGDATLVLPAQKLYVETIRRVKTIAQKIAKGLNISGPFNIQFISKNNDVKVIECNLRASRSFPFASKTFNFNFINLATKAMCGLPVKPQQFSLVDLDYVAFKAPMFSFTRLAGADPTLGVEMHSTGEAYLLSLMSSKMKVPITKAKLAKDNNLKILISIGTTADKVKFVDSAKSLAAMGYTMFCTPGTYNFFEENGVEGIKLLQKPQHAKKGASLATPTAADEPSSTVEMLSDGKIDFAINISGNDLKNDEITSGYLTRRTAVDFGVSLFTNLKCALLLVEALQRLHSEKTLKDQKMWTSNVLSMKDFYQPRHL
eukprot:g3695.t1